MKLLPEQVTEKTGLLHRPRKITTDLHVYVCPSDGDCVDHGNGAPLKSNSDTIFYGHWRTKIYITTILGFAWQKVFFLNVFHGVAPNPAAGFQFAQSYGAVSAQYFRTVWYDAVRCGLVILGKHRAAPYGENSTRLYRLTLLWRFEERSMYSYSSVWWAKPLWSPVEAPELLQLRVRIMV